MSDSKRTYKVLSIDAWADGHDGWNWNNWFHVETLEAIPDEDKAIDALIELGVLNEKARELCEVEDDQYNLVITDKRTREPLYAIEYGNEDYED
jgi:hypothetical protein